MKQDIHPQYYSDAKIKCACGAKFDVGSTKKEMQVEICSVCHPFFTGKEKLVDTAGRVDKFRQRVAAAKKIKENKSPKDETNDIEKPKKKRTKKLTIKEEKVEK